MRRRAGIPGGLLGGVGAGAAAPAPAIAGTGGVAAIDPSGGTAVEAPLQPVARRPVAVTFRVTPLALTAGQAPPRIAVRIRQTGIATVRARIVFRPLGAAGRLVVLDLGDVATDQLLRPAWPAGRALTAGRYTVALHAVSPDGATLQRGAHASGRTTLTVKPAP